MIDLAITPAPIDWVALLPVILLTSAGVIGMCVEMIRPKKTNNFIVFISLIGLMTGAGAVIYNWQSPTNEFFGAVYTDTAGNVQNLGLFIQDRFGQIAQLILITVAFLTVLFSEGYLREKRIPFGEFYPLVLWSTVGGMIMVTTRDLVILFLGLETLSIALYVLAGLSSQEKRSQESALKYFLLGAFASSFMLFGIALIYGATGTTHLFGIQQLFTQTISSNYLYGLAYMGLGMIVVGFGFKAAVVPFHMWTPDVYQGAPTNVTGFMAAGSKVAAFIAFARFLDGAIGMKEIYIPILSVIAILTMTIGNLIALAQRDVKRILGYSSIAHAGYILVAIIAYAQSQKSEGGGLGFETLVYYLLTYAIMTVGAFAILCLTARNGREGTLLEDYNGLWKRHPIAGAMMIVLMASLAGIPPTGGFFAKYFIFKDALETGLIALAIILAINAVISAVYYLRIAVAVYVDEPEFKPSRFAPMNPGMLLTTLLSGMGIFAAGIFTGVILNNMGLTRSAEQSNTLMTRELNKGLQPIKQEKPGINKADSQ